MSGSRQQPGQHQGPAFEFGEPYSGELSISMMAAGSEARRVPSNTSSSGTGFFATFFKRTAVMTPAVPYSGDLSIGQLEDASRARQQSGPKNNG